MLEMRASRSPATTSKVVGLSLLGSLIECRDRVED